MYGGWLHHLEGVGLVYARRSPFLFLFGKLGWHNTAILENENHKAHQMSFRVWRNYCDAFYSLQWKNDLPKEVKLWVIQVSPGFFLQDSKYDGLYKCVESIKHRDILFLVDFFEILDL